jgi:archaellum component FlaC
MADEPVTKEYLDRSLDKLGRMIAKGFDENTEQHRQIFERFEKIDGRFEKIDERFENVNARLDVIEGDLKEIKENIVPYEKHEDLESRVELLERKAGIVS